MGKKDVFICKLPPMKIHDVTNYMKGFSFNFKDYSIKFEKMTIEDFYKGDKYDYSRAIKSRCRQ